MSSEEFLTWQAFYRIEPFGHVRGDIQTAQLAHAIGSIAAGFAGNSAGSLNDYILQWQPPEKKEEASEDWKAARESLMRWNR